jgi:hypothetical protein
MKLSRENAGTVSVVAGIVAATGPVAPFLLGAIALPIALVSGVIAVRNKQKTLGWMGLSLSILAIIIWIFVIVAAIQMSHNPND